MRRLFLRTTLDHDSLGVFRRLWAELMRAECHEHSLWSGPFFRKLREGAAEERFQLSAVWSVNMIYGSFCFPGYVAALAGRANTDYVRHGLLSNAWEESGGVHHTARSHFWLSVRLAKVLGLSDGEIERIVPLTETTTYTEGHYHGCATAEFDVGLGMICLIEEFTTPEFSALYRAIVGSCETAAGLSQDEFILRGGGEYFTANIADDERHREEMPKVVAALLASREVDLRSESELVSGLEGIRVGIRRSLELRRTFFDGIVAYVSSGRTYRDLVGYSSVQPAVGMVGRASQ